MKTIKKILLSTLLVMCISACSSLLKSEQTPERVYLLKPYLSSANNAMPLQKSISLSVSAVPGLDTNKILILEPDAHLNHYASARWTAYSTEVVASLFANTLESRGFYLVNATNSTSKTDALSLEIKEFYTTNSSVHMNLIGNIECNSENNKKINPIILRAVIAVKDNKLSEIVAAYQIAINQVSKELLEQVVGACE